MTTNFSPTCAQCNSPLILVSEKTETIEGSRFPQTTKIFRCSNQSCQDEIDKQTVKRQEQKAERHLADGKRAEEKQLLQARRKEENATQA